MNIEELRELCTLTVELTRLRQNECKHLCIENFAPELLGKLIRERQSRSDSAPVAPGLGYVQPGPVILYPPWVPRPAWEQPWKMTC